MHRIGILENPVQYYEWGSKTAIPQLIGEPTPSDKPMAEMWMGAHPNAPSSVLVGTERRRLNEIIAKAPEKVLGKEIARRYGQSLPFLFKVLASARPLSIQAHPNLQQAQKGFAWENEIGIPLQASNRNYKDDNHKPEVICALSSFYALKGFRPIPEILRLMGALSLSSLTSQFRVLREKPDPGGLRQFFTALLTMDREARRRAVVEAVERAERILDEDVSFRWIAILHEAYPGDIGVLAPAFLNLVRLESGEALYLPAGQLHSYLEGVGIELMANSDNVLRGGLTSKYVDAQELIRIVQFQSDSAEKIRAVEHGPCERVYLTPAQEFLLSVISVDADCPYMSSLERSVEITICTRGKALVRDLGNGENLRLSQGQSMIVPASVLQYRIEGEATLYKASVPSSLPKER